MAITVEDPKPGEFDSLPAYKPAKKPLEDWKLEALGKLHKKGGEARVRYADAKERRSSLSSLSRLTHQRGIGTTVKFGSDEEGEFFIVKNVGEVPPLPPPPGRGRGKKSQQED